MTGKNMQYGRVWFLSGCRVLRSLVLIMMAMALSQCMQEDYPVVSQGQVVVHSGECVYSIAHKHKVSVRGLIAVNHLAPPYLLHPGDVLRLPGDAEESSQVVFDAPRLLEVEEVSVHHTKSPWVDPDVPRDDNDAVASPVVAPSKKAVDPRLVAEAKKKWSAEVVEKTLPPKVVTEKVVTEKVLPTAAAAEKHIAGQKKDKGEKKQPVVNIPPSAPLANTDVSQKPAPLSLRFPAEGTVIRKFGSMQKNGRCSQGIRISVRKGQPIRCAGSGRVYGIGNKNDKTHAVVLVRHANGFLSAYGSLDKILVKEGQEVSSQTILGHAQEDYLYFELRNEEMQPVDPLHYIH